MTDVIAGVETGAEKVEQGLAKALGWLKKEFSTLQNLGEKVAVVLKREKQLQPNFIGGVKLLFEDVTALVAEVSVAAGDKGINLAEDSKAYASLKKLVVDVEEFAPVVQEAIKALE